MIGSISSSSTFMSQLSQSSNSNSSNNSLTSSQLETISSVLESYDADNLSQSDAQSIVEAFEEAGIQPSVQLETAMEESGFDAHEIGSLAGVQGQGSMPPPPPPPSEEEVSSVSSLLDSLLNTSNNEESTTSFEDIMDYTSRILNLNEDSKDSVMNLLDKYSNQDNDYTTEETNTLLKTSLSQILSDASNYKKVSFFA